MIPLLLTTLAALAAEPLFVESFDAGWGDWQTQGEAQFSLDAGRSGQAARIVVPAEVAPGYAKAYRRIEPVVRGDQLAASAWVRSEELADGNGPYLALVFLNAEGERTGIAHSALRPNMGAGGWEELTVGGTAPRGTVAAELHLLLHAHGSAWFDDVRLERVARLEPWPDLGAAERSVVVRADDVVLERFGGVGFHVFHHVFPAPPDDMDTVIAKRWLELRPSFARLNHSDDWTRDELDQVAEHLLRLKATGTAVYFATWGPDDTQPGAERRAWAERVADQLAYLVQQRGCTNVRWYCMTNELSLNGWGTLFSDLPKFEDYHRELAAAFAARNLEVGLLASDASPIQRWPSIAWAAEQMDDVTAVYGGHHYLNDRPLDDERFYPWFRDEVARFVDVAHDKGKDFILGEFGCKQDGRVLNGVKQDRCVYFETPAEAMVGIQLSEAALAAINAGVYAMGSWTFMDFPDRPGNYLNKWGVFRRGTTPAGTDYSTRDHYYGFGLLTRWLRGGGPVARVETSDPWLRAAAVRQIDGLTPGGWTVAVINRYPGEVPLALTFEGLATPPERPFRKFVYDPANVPQHPFGDLPPHAATLALRDGRLTDRLGPNTLAVYTTAYDDDAPPPVTGLRAEPGEGGTRLTWDASPAPDLAYYRVYHLPAEGADPVTGEQVGSTIATHFAAPTAPAYAVVAVDHSGNASR